TVDAQNRTLTLDQVDYYTHTFDRNQQSDLLTLYFDGQTQVLFRGESYKPENLEPGDVIAVRVDDVRGTLIADQIDVVADARGNAANYPQSPRCTGPVPGRHRRRPGPGTLQRPFCALQARNLLQISGDADQRRLPASAHRAGGRGPPRGPRVPGRVPARMRLPRR